VFTPVKILVVGSGGREHALVRALGTDDNEVHAAPGNAGIAAEVPVHAVDAADPRAVADLAQELGVDLVVVGPELPLVNGVVDLLNERGIPCFGPSAAAARLEGSKAFAKEVMAAAAVPTALARVCTSIEAVEEAMRSFGPPFVIKDDGLAAGKGVVVTNDEDQAIEHARACLDKAEGAQVVVEEFLDGPEVSLFAITDGTTVIPLQPAQDFKRVGEADTGPNTGGMGAYSPLPWAPADLVETVVDRVLQPTIDYLRSEGTPFTGLLYAGLALTSRGIRVVEFNARFGDPETQVVLARMISPLAPYLYASAKGGLDVLPAPRWRQESAVVVVVAAENYPEAPVLGDPIEGLEEANSVDGATVLHAGTTFTDAGEVVSAGGRVLGVVGVGADIENARKCAYEAVDRINLRGSHYRRDIAAGKASS
jgi:phosphoribosylamine---glycine ligase